MKILITGGPVHLFIDDMRVLSNSAKGGQAAAYADLFAKKGHEVTYLTSKLAYKPKNEKIKIVYHEGFEDYRRKVNELSKKNDLVIMAAAVANFMNKGGRFKGKINPNAEGELTLTLIPSPKVINEVKKANPKCTLVGFKLMSGSTDEELIEGAWKVLLNSKADLVVANDKMNLMRKIILGKDKSTREMNSLEGVVDFIEKVANDKHFKTKVLSNKLTGFEKEIKEAEEIAEANKEKFVTWSKNSNRRFGCVAVNSEKGMIVSPREKDAPEDHWAWVAVKNVDFANLIIKAEGGKASLNAPLLWNVFQKNPRAEYILHYHKQREDLPTVEWAPPGTLREAQLARKGSFNIKQHGTIEIYNKKGELIV